MKIKDLSGNLLLAELTDDISERGGVDHQGETLKEFIELSGLTDHACVTELHEMLVSCGIQSPFRELIITTEVIRSCGYTIAVTNEQYNRFVRGELSIDELDPDRFSLEEAYFETEFSDCVSSTRDYAVYDGSGNDLVEWNEPDSKENAAWRR